MKNRKVSRFLALFLVVFMVFTQLSFVTSAEEGIGTFDDIKGHYAEDVIKEWVKRGYIEGYSPDTFAPNNNITRAEFISLFNRAFKIEEPKGISKKYSDLSADKWYYRDVQKATKLGIISGYDDGRFGPNDPIKRQDASVIISRYLSLTEIYDTTYINKFSDQKDVSPYAVEHVAAMAELKLIGGNPDGTFRPKGSITRADSVIMLNNAYKMIVGDSGVVGKVYSNGKAVAGAVISIAKKGEHGTVATVTTDENGLYKADLEAGDYDLLVSKDEEVTYISGITVRNNYKSFNKLVIEEGQRVMATLKDINGIPLPNTTIYFKTNPYFKATSDDHGFIEVTLPKGRQYETFYEKEGTLISGGKFSTTDVTGVLEIGEINTIKGVLIEEPKVPTPAPTPTPAPAPTPTPTPTPTEHRLTIVAGAGGTVTGANGNYSSGSGINITATPNEGYRFINWTSSNGGVFGDANSATTTFTMPDNGATLTAHFEGITLERPLDVTINTEGLTPVTIEGAETAFVVDHKIEHLTGSVEGATSIASMNLKILNSTLEIADESIEPATNWSIANPPLLVGRNDVTVTVTTTDGKTATEEVILINRTLENTTTVELDTEDDDGDGLLNYQEAIYSTDKNEIDTDGDGLTDYQEVVITNTNPLKMDSDGNSITDDQEDPDGDQLKNIDELILNGEPFTYDTDEDGLGDGEEKLLGTSLDNPDTDGDGLSDKMETEYGTDPLDEDTDDDGILDGDEVYSKTATSGDVTEEDPVKAAVTLDLTGDQLETLSVTKVEETDPFLSKDIPGYLGTGFDFNVEGTFTSATLQFEFETTEAMLNNPEGFQPRIYYFNEEKQILEELPSQTVAGNTVSATVTHFSKYILLNKVEFDKVWENEIKLPSEENKETTVLDIVFVIDISASMSWNDADWVRKDVVKSFVDKLGADDRSALITFRKIAETKTSLTSDKTIITQAINGMYNDSGYNSNSGTNGSDGIKSALDMLEANHRESNKFIIFVTDGEDNRTSYNYNDLIATAQANNIVIYTIGLGDSLDSQLLRKVGTSTGGGYYHATAADGLMEEFDKIEGETIDLYTDTDEDGISDYYEKLINDGVLRLGTGGTLYGLDYTNPDTDGDGILDGEELEVSLVEMPSDSTDIRQNVYMKMNSNPLLQDTDEDGWNDNEDETPLKAVKYKNIEYLLESKYKGQANVTILVNQPIEGSRIVMDGDVGHTFIRIDNGTDVAIYKGFYPWDTENSAVNIGMLDLLLNVSLHFTSVDGKILNDQTHVWNIAWTTAIDVDTANQLIEYAENYEARYNLQENNCTSFSVRALDQHDVGVKDIISWHFWTLPEGWMYVITIPWGYSPADAGEDIRENAGEYIIRLDRNANDECKIVVNQ